jgi:hypothetical protein
MATIERENEDMLGIDVAFEFRFLPVKLFRQIEETILQAMSEICSKSVLNFFVPKSTIWFKRFFAGTHCINNSTRQSNPFSNFPISSLLYYSPTLK